MNNDCWHCVLILLDHTDYLTLRLISKEWCELFNSLLPVMTSIYDIHPSLNITEFITGLSHRLMCWRKVPSFSIQRAEFFDSISTENSITIITLARIMNMEDFPWYKINVSYSELHQKFINGNIKLTTVELIKIASSMAILSSHKQLIRYLDRISKLHSTVQYIVFKEFVYNGISPYYLDLMINNPILRRRLQGRDYVKLIISCRNEHLLKIETKKRKIIIGKDWPRGQEICKNKL